MKKIFLLLILLSTIGYLNAQEERYEHKTIFSKPTKVRGYVSSINTVAIFNSKTAYMNGKQAAGIFNDHFIFGFYKMDIWHNIGPEINFNHKGLWLGYIFMPKQKIHFNINAQAGKGEINIYKDISDIWLNDDLVYVITPSIEVEFNLTNFCRIGIGANYTYTMDLDQIEGYGDNNFSNIGACVNLKFGWFK